MKIQLTEKAAEILLALTALIWGSGFVCYKNLMSLLTLIQFVVVRSFFSAVCAGVFFLCVIRRASRREWLGGFLLGGILAAAGLVQTYGIRITSSGNCAFLTGTNVVMVPFLSWALTKKKPGRSNLFSALMMFAGVCLLTVDFNNITAVNAGDLLSFLGAFLYAVHIAVTGKLSGTVRPKAVTCLQFLALFTVNLLFVPLEETPFIIPPAAVLPAAYLGIVSIFIGHTLQIICQEKVDSTKAAVLLSLEGVFGSIFSAILLGERYRLPALAGFVLIFLSILLSQTGGRVRNGPGPVW